MAVSLYVKPYLTTCVRWAVCLGLALTVLATPGPTLAAPAGWAQVTVTGHGIRLTLSLQRRAYPRNALVRVWARTQNVTRHTLFLYDNGPQAAGKYIPQAVVLAEPGGQPLPISLTDYQPYPGPAPLSIPLPAGAVRNIPEIVILRGPLVRLDLTFSIGTSPPAFPGRTISTPLLRLNLTAPDTPTVTLHVPPAQPSADITPTSPVQGNLLAVWSEACGSGSSPSSVEQNIYWTAISPHITPTCSPLQGWHEIAGWLNHSVAEIDWGSRASDARSHL